MVMPTCESIIDVPKPAMQPSMPQPSAATSASARPMAMPGSTSPVRLVTPIMRLAAMQMTMPRTTRGPISCL